MQNSKIKQSMSPTQLVKSSLNEEERIDLTLSEIEDTISIPTGQYPFVSIIMPAFNEDKTIGKTIREIASLMALHCLPFEIIVVDDGSSDRTSEEALRCGVLVLSNGQNRGKGYSLRRGLSVARGDLILTMDSDGEHRPVDIVRLLRCSFDGVDVVAGSRFLNGLNPTSSIHFVGNKLFNAAIMILTGRLVTDSQTGFRVLRRRVCDSLCLESDGYEVETEITLKSLRNGFSFREVPIGVRRREFGRTRIRLLSDGRKILQTILVLGLKSLSLEK